MKTKTDSNHVMPHPMSMFPPHSMQINEAAVGYSRRIPVNESVPQPASIPIMVAHVQPSGRHFPFKQGQSVPFRTGKHLVPMYIAHDVVRNAVTFTKSKLTAAVLRPPSNMLKRPRSSPDLDDLTTVASEDSKRRRNGSEDTHQLSVNLARRSMSIDSDGNRDTDSILSTTKESPSPGSLNGREDTASSENRLCSNVISHSGLAPSPPVVSPFDIRIPPMVRAWGERMKQVHPVDYLQHLLTTRGYDNNYLESVAYRTARHGALLTEKQVLDYSCDIVSAVRTSDLSALRRLQREGKSMAACNRFSESIVHMACRRSDLDTIQFILDNIETVLLVDDYGRTPLHDACWRPEPKFDLVALLMDTHLDLIRCVDKRGSTPLHYVRREHWAQWCAFLEVQKEKYWAPISRPSLDAIALVPKPVDVQITSSTATSISSSMLPPKPPSISTSTSSASSILLTSSSSVPTAAQNQDSLTHPHIHSRITTSINQSIASTDVVTLD